MEPVYLQGIGLAAIAARSPFGTKVGAGIILPLLLMVVTTGRGLGAGVLQQRFDPMSQRQALLYLSVLFCHTPSARSVYNVCACPSSRLIKHSDEPSLYQDTWFEIVQ